MRREWTEINSNPRNNTDNNLNIYINYRKRGTEIRKSTAANKTKKRRNH